MAACHLDKRWPQVGRALLAQYARRRFYAAELELRWGIDERSLQAVWIHLAPEYRAALLLRPDEPSAPDEEANRADIETQLSDQFPNSRGDPDFSTDIAAYFHQVVLLARLEAADPARLAILLERVGEK